MFIYSSTTETFLKKVKALAKEILANEVSLPYSGKRLLYNRTYYPLHFVCFEHEKILGFYDPTIYQIALNKNLMFKIDDEIIKNVLRHEVAHFLCHIFHGDDVKTHGIEFREVFKRYGWDPNFSKSKIMLEEVIPEREKDQKILEKINKLLKLSNSSNEHEANLATIKANDLIAKHNLESIVQCDEHTKDTEETYVIRVASFTRKNALHDGLYEVLQSFQVYPIFNQGRGGGYLEVVGSRVNVTVAEYMANYLSLSIESIWKNLKKENSKLKGIVAKNSFTRAFCSTISKNLKEHIYQTARSKELTLTKNELTIHVNRVYPKVRASYTSAKKTDAMASNIGRALGEKFQFKKGLNRGSSPKLLK
ncbi:DUF2786 domain-containing protein [Bacteriovorax sp. Seq25_V]|uniref:DUF2786 domain-containing protein n=1 Tax=Bacteriovorax sp. Seq25_V TaxID=1201288 RepID=UPI00038A3579|nr:DUF2786 domain-containing protein [Bacteriovorax sp. Seq25_V]EQC43729.1 PF10979 family protein [Bacteriovorax sp. Seq25_V]